MIKLAMTSCELWSENMPLQATLEYSQWRGAVMIAPEEQPVFWRWLYGQDMDYWEHSGTLYFRTGLERVQLRRPQTVEEAYLAAVAQGRQDPNDKDAQAAFVAQWHIRHEGEHA